MSAGRVKNLTIGILVMLAAAFAFLWTQERDTDPAEVTEYLSSQDEDAARVSERVLDAVINYSPSTLEEQAGSLSDLATGGFLEDYETLIEEGLGEAVQATGATSSGRIASGPDIAFTSGRRATAVARVVQEVETASSSRTVFSVMQIGLVQTASGWKAEDLEILSQNFL